MSSAALTIDQDVWRPKFNPWLIAVVVALAAFMEVLDTSIANVALPYMAGNLGASNDQSTWVLTSYLVSNAIILPISGWRAGAQTFFHVLSRYLYGEFFALRPGTQSWTSAFVPRAARRRRRWVAANGTGHSCGHFSPAAAWSGLCAIR